MYGHVCHKFVLATLLTIYGVAAWKAEQGIPVVHAFADLAIAALW